MTTEQRPGADAPRSGMRAIHRRWLRMLRIGATAAVVGVVPCLVGREVALWTLPDVPEPVDAATFGVLPAADNAIPAYAAAWRQLHAGGDRPPPPRSMPIVTRVIAERWWWHAVAEAEAWLAADPGALDPWLEATRRPDAAPVAGAPETTHRVPQILESFAMTAAVEARRRRNAGDLDRAWAYHLGAIRSGLHAMRHAGHSVMMLSLTIGRDAIEAAEPWVDAPGQTPDRLRRALADLAACRPIEPTNSNLVLAEYLASRKDLADPGRWTTSQLDAAAPNFWIEHLSGYVRARDYLRHEPERSLRVLRLITAGQLAQCDRPADVRARLASKEFGIYDVDARTPPAARVAPVELAAWVEASRCRVPTWNVVPSFEQVEMTRRLLDRFRLRVASRAHALDHGGEPPRTYDDLVPAYLDAMPAGSTAADPVPTP